MTAPELLAITTDELLADDVLRLGAAAGAQTRVVPDALAAAPTWSMADMVVLDQAVIEQVAAMGLPPRARVLVVATPPVPNRVWRDAMAIGAHTVVTLPDGERWLVEAIAEASSGSGAAAPIITVVGARGGAGASVLAAGLARVAAAERLSVYLVDLDPAGFGQNVLLGVDRVEGNGWDDLSAAVGRIPPRSLRAGLPLVAGVRLLTWTSPPAILPPEGVVGSVLDSAARDADVVIVDLARWLCADGTAPRQQAVEVLSRSAQVLLVCPADVRAAMGARRLLLRGSLAGLPLGLVVRGPSPGALSGEDIAEALGLPLIAHMPAESRLDRALEDGLPPGRSRSGPLLGTCLRLLRGVARSTVTAG